MFYRLIGKHKYIIGKYTDGYLLYSFIVLYTYIQSFLFFKVSVDCNLYCVDLTAKHLSTAENICIIIYYTLAFVVNIIIYHSLETFLSVYFIEFVAVGAVSYHKTSYTHVLNIIF